jgi:hypothetical protein
MNSRIRQSTTPPQPMNRADEYRFVTGGRPEMYIRSSRPKVWTASANSTTSQAVRPKPLAQKIHDREAKTKAST